MTTRHRGRTFDRVPGLDPRNRSHPITALVGQPARRRQVWRGPDLVLNQDAEGACVGHGHTHEATSSPVRVDFKRSTVADKGFPAEAQAFAFALYRAAQKIDEWPGEAYSGTSVLAAAKIMKSLGVYGEYRWAFGVEDVISAVIAHGPVVIGIPWYDAMYEAPGGEVRIGGSVVGGHCLLVLGYDPKHRFTDGAVGEGLLLLNSWGPGWGLNGQAWIRKADLGALLREQGDACVPVRRSYVRPKVPRLAMFTGALRRLLTGPRFGSRAA
jgi:hypothetical protein